MIFATSGRTSTPSGRCDVANGSDIGARGRGRAGLSLTVGLLAAVLLGPIAAHAPSGPVPALSPATPRRRPTPQVLASPVLSGLAWRSGARADDGFDGWRGRKRDVVLTFVRHDTWKQMLEQLAGSYFRDRVRLAPQAVVSLAMLTGEARGQHAACAQGRFDDIFRRIGALLVRAGAGQAVARIGWEANAGSGSHEWGIDTAAQVPAYVACFRREAAALKSTAPGVKVEWTSAKRGKLDFNVLDMYPGDDAVDIVGVHYYDTGPEKSTQALWDEYYGKTDDGGPWGLGAWLAAARAHGKRLAVSEWAVWDQGQGAAAADDPVYVENMYRFFRDHAADIAYETYFNVGPDHQLFPTTRFPRAAAAYREHWSLGR